MSVKQEIESDAAFKAWPFSSDFNFACKNSQFTAAACKCYCPLVVNLTLPSCKEFHLKWSRVLRSVSENVAMYKNLSDFMWKLVFLLFQNVSIFIKSNFVFLCYFLQYVF